MLPTGRANCHPASRALPAFTGAASQGNTRLTQGDLGMAERAGVDVRVYRRQYRNQEQRGCNACRYELPVFGHHDGPLGYSTPGTDIEAIMVNGA
jgi:hypothetical protein